MMNSTQRLKQHGGTLLEALIAIVILSIGMLGIAGLNLASLKITKEGGNRGIAAILSQEIADSLRATQTAARANALANITAAIDSSQSLPNCYTANCTAASQVQHALIEWAKSIDNAQIGGALARARASSLPEGRGVVCYDDTPNDGSPAAAQCSNNANHPLVVKVWWTERPSNATTGATQQGRFTTSIVL